MPKATKNAPTPVLTTSTCRIWLTARPAAHGVQQAEPGDQHHQPGQRREHVLPPGPVQRDRAEHLQQEHQQEQRRRPGEDVVRRRVVLDEQRQPAAPEPPLVHRQLDPVRHASRRQRSNGPHAWVASSWSRWPRGSIWNVECSTSKWPDRQACNRSSTGPTPVSASTSSSTTKCAESTGTPLVIVQACRSCTSTTPPQRRMWSRTCSMSTSDGAASSRTSVASFSSRSVRGTISTAISSDTTASARSQPVYRITSALAITAAAPNASASTSRTAPLIASAVVSAPRSTSSETAFATRPTRAKTRTR